MIRSLVILLVFGNIIVFALSAGWFGDAATPSNPVVGHRPLSPERIRIVSRGEPPPLLPKLRQCIEWKDLAPPQANAIERVAAGHKDLALVREETLAASRNYWVYIPVAKGGRAAAEKKAAELKALGVKSFRLVQDGADGAWAVSLGVYDSEAKSREAHAAFKKSGVRSAQHGMSFELPAQFRIRLRGPSESLAAVRKLADPVAPLDCPRDGTNAASDAATNGVAAPENPGNPPVPVAPTAGQS